MFSSALDIDLGCSKDFGSIPYAAKVLGSSPIIILGSIPKSFGSIPASSLGSIPDNSFGSIPINICGSMPARSFGSIPASSFGSRPYAAAIFGSIPPKDLPSLELEFLVSVLEFDAANVEVDGRTSKFEKVVVAAVVIFAMFLDVVDWSPAAADEDDFGSSKFATICGSSPRLFNAFSSRPWSILGSNPSNLGSNPPEVLVFTPGMFESGHTFVVDKLVAAYKLVECMP